MNKLNNVYFFKIIIRDLKPENFLLKNKNDINSIKLIDFGLSQKLKEDELMTQPNGTVFFIFKNKTKKLFLSQSLSTSLLKFLMDNTAGKWIIGYLF